MIQSTFAKSLVSLLASGSIALAAAPKNVLPANPLDPGDVAKEDSWRDNRWNQTDVGQFMSSSLPTPNGMILKGLSIKIGANDEAAICYDTDQVALRAAWTGKFLQFDATRFGLLKSPVIAGELRFLTAPDSGWITARPAYRGFHLNGKRVVLSYLLGEAPVLRIALV